MYTAEVWTTVGQIINGKRFEHEHWAVLNDKGELVACGGSEFCKRYAGELNAKKISLPPEDQKSDFRNTSPPLPEKKEMK